MKRWLVTGGVGFIGSHLCRALLKRGDAVRIVDDFSDAPYPTALKRENQAALTRDFAGVEMIEGCVTDKELASGSRRSRTHHPPRRPRRGQALVRDLRATRR